jgi:CubicO group peptidase (beta-lactamase class C family)
MRRRGFIKVSSSALAAVVFRAKGASSEAKVVPSLDQLIPTLMRKHTIPGASIALVDSGRLLWNKAFGVKNAATKAPVTDTTLFEAASISKTVFAYAVMKLCETGVLNLDTPLSKYGAKSLLEGDPRRDLITVRHVLSHTSGFQDFRSRKEPLRIHFTPGEKFLYSGEGYFYLHSVVTHLTGRVDPADCARYESDLEVCGTDFDAWIKRTLLQPFGMNSSSYLCNEELAARCADPHDSTATPSKKKTARPPDVARYGSCGGLHTTPLEYSKFILAVIDPEAADAHRLSRNSLETMLRPQIELPPDEKIDGADSWALGWGVQSRKTGKVIVHSGGQAGIQSLTMASPDRKAGFVILTNSDNGWKLFHDPTFTALMDELLGGAA